MLMAFASIILQSVLNAQNGKKDNRPPRQRRLPHLP